MNIENLKKEITEARVLINDKKLLIERNKQIIADYLCPFNVGDNVLDENGKRQIIASISATPYDLWYSFKVFHIKKDGSLYKKSMYAYNIEKYTKAGNKND